MSSRLLSLFDQDLFTNTNNQKEEQVKEIFPDNLPLLNFPDEKDDKKVGTENASKSEVELANFESQNDKEIISGKIDLEGNDLILSALEQTENEIEKEVEAVEQNIDKELIETETIQGIIEETFLPEETFEDTIVDELVEENILTNYEEQPIPTSVTIDTEIGRGVSEIKSIGTENKREEDGSFTKNEKTEIVAKTTEGENTNTKQPTKRKSKVKEEEKAENEPKQIISREWIGTKQYYSIGEVAELFNVNTSHIRFWTIEFGIRVRTTGKGDRLYTSKQIHEIRNIYILVKEQGFTLAGAKAKIKEQSKKGAKEGDLKKSLTVLKNKLVTVRNQIDKL